MGTLWTTQKRMSPLPAILLLLTCLLIGGMAVLWLKGPDWARAYLLAGFQEQFGDEAKIEIKELGLNGAQLEEIRLDSDALSAEIATVNLAYNVPDLLKGKLHSVHVEGAVLDVDIAQLTLHPEGQKATKAKEQTTGLSTVDQLVRKLPQLSVNNLQLRARDLDEVYQAEFSLATTTDDSDKLRVTAQGRGEGLGVSANGLIDSAGGQSILDFSLSASDIKPWQRLIARLYPQSEKLSWSAAQMASEGRLLFDEKGLANWGASIDTLQASIALPLGGAFFEDMVVALRGDRLGLSGASAGGHIKQINNGSLRMEEGGFLLNFDPAGGLEATVRDTRWSYGSWLRTLADVEANIAIATPLAETTAQGSAAWKSLSLFGVSVNPATAVFSMDKQQLILAVAAATSPQLAGVALNDLRLIARLDSKQTELPMLQVLSQLNWKIAGGNGAEDGLSWALETTGGLNLNMSAGSNNITANYKLSDAQANIGADSWQLDAQLSGSVGLQQKEKRLSLLPGFDLDAITVTLPAGMSATFSDAKLEHSVTPVLFTNWKSFAEQVKEADYWLDTLSSRGSFATAEFQLTDKLTLQLEDLGINYSRKRCNFEGDASLSPFGFPLKLSGAFELTKGFSFEADANMREQTLANFLMFETLTDDPLLQTLSVSGQLEASAKAAFGAGADFIASGKIELQQGAISSEMLGLQASGVNAAINLTDIVNAQTEERQIIQFERLETGGIVLTSGELEFTASTERFELHRGQAAWVGGTLFFEPFVIVTGEPVPEIRVSLSNLSLDELRPIVFPQAKALQGKVEGQWAFRIGKDAVRPVSGSLRMASGVSGRIEYVDPGWTKMLYSGDDTLAVEYRDFLEQAMEGLNVSYLQIDYSPAADGEQSLDLVLQGSAQIGGRNINVNMEDLAVIGDLEAFLDLGLFFKKFDRLSVSLE